MAAANCNAPVKRSRSCSQLSCVSSSASGIASVNLFGLVSGTVAFSFSEQTVAVDPAVGTTGVQYTGNTCARGPPPADLTGQPACADLTTLGLYYRQHIRLMEHWKAVIPDRIFEVRYEDLVGDLEGVSRRMIDFVGLEWDPACLQFFETERTVSTISKWQVRQPIYRTSIARWKPFERHLGPLRDALGDLVASVAE